MFKFIQSELPRLLGLGLLAVSMQSAFAADQTFNAGTLPSATPFTQYVAHSPETFLDTFNFNLSSNADVSGAVVSLTLTLGPFDLLHITNPSVALYSTANPLVALATGTTGFTVTGISPANYFVTVSGKADGLSGGTYLFGLSAAAVPEPEQWMLFAAGLAAVGGMSRRRLPV